MKKILSCLILVASISCVSTKYNVYEKPNNFENIHAGNKYTFYDLQDHKSFITVTSVDNDSIVGIRKKERIAISKRDIKEIKKNKTGATVALIGSSAVIIGGILIIVEVAKTGRDLLADVLGG